MTSFYESSCANNGKGALNTPETLFDVGLLCWAFCRPGGAFRSGSATWRTAGETTYTCRMTRPLDQFRIGESEVEWTTDSGGKSAYPRQSSPLLGRASVVVV
eukprot:9284940-Pyramimonas_sp.AAC.1